MPEYVIAGLWGLLSGSGLLVGAIVADALFGKLTHRMISAVMGFGGGVLIAVVATELIGERVSDDLGPTAVIALLAGAAIFSVRASSTGAALRSRSAASLTASRKRW